MIFLLAFKLLHVSPIWNDILTNKPFVFWHSLVAEHTNPSLLFVHVLLTWQGVLFWSVLASVHLASFSLHYRFTTTRGRCFSLCSCWELIWTDCFLHRNRVCFLILCNEDQILSLLDQCSEGECVIPCVCVFIYFVFLIACAFTSQCLWTDELFFHLCCVRLPIHSSVPLSFKVTTETCVATLEISIFIVCFGAVCDVLGTKCFSEIQTGKCHIWPTQWLSASMIRDFFKGHPRSARQIEPP